MYFKKNRTDLVRRQFFLLFLLVAGIACGSEILSEHYTYKIRSINSTQLVVHKRILVDDEFGKDAGKISIFSNNLNQVKSIKCRILDKNDKVLKKYSKKDFAEISRSPGMLYNSNKYFSGNFKYPGLPHIIDLKYTVEINSLFAWPDWYPQNWLETRHSSYTLEIPRRFKFSYREKGAVPDPVVNDDSTKFVWEMYDIPRTPDELMAAPEDEDQLGVIFASKIFELGGITCHADSWLDFGNWVDEFLDSQYNLEMEDRILDEGPVLVDRAEIAQGVLEYIQTDMRYVALYEKVINGWLPHTTRSIMENGYGDCKDLAVFFIDQLSLYGITSYPVKILTRNRGLTDTSIVSQQFNHVIAVIPTEDDTFWVDCTGKYNTIYDPPYQDEGCFALIVKPDGSEMVKTPVSPAEDNKIQITGQAVIDANGDADFDGQIILTGKKAQFYRYMLLDENASDQEKIFTRWLSEYIPSVDLIEMQLMDFDDVFKPAIIKFRFKAYKYARVSRKRLFLNPGFYHRVQFDGEKPSDRETALLYSYNFMEIDSITYILPEGLSVENLAQSVNISGLNSVYDVKTDVSGDSLIYQRRRVIGNRKVDLDDYEEYYRFMKKVEKTDNSNSVFLFND